MPLVKQSIPTLFGGVSRQPARVRLTNQVEEADNVYPSVDNGGLSRRSGIQSINDLDNLLTGSEYSVFGIDRDESEKYVIVFGDDTLRVYDAFTGAIQTVNFNDASIPDYLTGSPSLFRVTSVADYTFIANSDIVLYMDSEPFGRTLTNVSVSSITWNSPTTTRLDITLNTSSAHSLTVGDWFKIHATPNSVTQTELDGLWCHVSSVTDSDTVVAIMHDEDAPASTITQVAYDGATLENAPIVRFSIADFRTAYGTSGTVTSPGTLQYAAKKGRVDGKVNTFTALPASPTNGHVYRVTPAPNEPDVAYYVQWNAADSIWEECPKPGDQYLIDQTTLPIKMIREADGSFEVSLWGDDVSGLALSNHGAAVEPPFIGRTISDLVYWRNRLVFLSDDSVYTSRNGDVFHLFPEKASLVLASDPIDLTASDTGVVTLRWAVPYRKELTLTADSSQFEVSGDLLTPEDARIDSSTRYAVDIAAKPIVMAEQVFFPAKSETAGILYEYYLDDETLANTAANITKHADGYIPPGCRQLTADALTERLFWLPEDHRNHVYVYTNYWDRQEKVQSAWSRVVLGDTESDAYVHGILRLGNYIYMVVRRPDDVYLERLPTGLEGAPTGLDFAVHLDRRVQLTGVYNPGTGNTTWTTPYQHADNVVIVLGEQWATEDSGYTPLVDFPSNVTVRAEGDFSTFPVYAGIPYRSSITLSKQYIRDENGTAVTDGILTLRSMQWDYKDSGYFQVEVTPSNRDSKTYEFTGRDLGSELNVVGEGVVMPEGAFKHRVASKGDTVVIELSSSSHLPFTITGASWVGAYVPRIKDQQGG